MKCICNEGLHDGERIDCACECHKMSEQEQEEMARYDALSYGFEEEREPKEE